MEQQSIPTHHVCMICKRTFTLKTSLDRHMKLKHSGKGRLSCKYCFRRISRADYMLKHEAICRVKRKIYLNLEAQRLMKKKFRKSIQTVDTSINSLTIGERTNLSIIERSQWRPWQQTNGVGKSLIHYRCKVCSKRFRRIDSLTRHYRIAHECEEKPQCKFCSKPFSREDAVLRHQLGCSERLKKLAINSGSSDVNMASVISNQTLETTNNYIDLMDPDISLHYSGQELKNNANGVLHQPNEDPQNLEISQGAYQKHRYICNECEQSFSRKDNLNRHVNLVHSADKKLSCKFCSKILSRRDAIQRHEIKCPKNPLNG